MSAIQQQAVLPEFSRGFLPQYDPLRAFPADSPLATLDELGESLPNRLLDPGFRHFASTLKLPDWPDHWTRRDHLAEMRLYYIRLGFLASAYINQVGQPAIHVLPANIAVPLHTICRLMDRPPILSYDGYALYNWYRLDPDGPIALGNIDSIQNFVSLYDEHWFILVHVEIEALAANILHWVLQIHRWLDARWLNGDSPSPQAPAKWHQALNEIADCIQDQERVLSRIPQKMDPALYFKTFRPYIRFFENVRYQGVDMQPMNFRGETGAQSSIMPLLVALMKIPHKASSLTNHLLDIRQYMPAGHRALIESTEQLADFRDRVDPQPYNRVLEAIGGFRQVHYSWAEEYINRRTDDPRGTGGTPYMQWLQQLIDETLAHRK